MKQLESLAIREENVSGKYLCLIFYVFLYIIQTVISHTNVILIFSAQSYCIKLYFGKNKYRIHQLSKLSFLN